MNDVALSIEGVSPELTEAYRLSGMDRGKGGSKPIEWAFGSHPDAFAVARAGEKIVGISGYIRTRMTLGTGEGTACQAVDSFIAPEMRGKGLFTMLAAAYEAHATAQGHDLIWGFPNDNAAPAWFGKLGWRNHGQVPLLVKPLRAGYFMRKLRLPLDFPLSFSRDQNIAATSEIGEWVGALWERITRRIGIATIRDQSYLTSRLFCGPHANRYRVVVAANQDSGALLATRQETKHGGSIAYVMEAMGGYALDELLHSELGRLRDKGAEIALAWSFPWSPNSRSLRAAGFHPLPERLRPFRMWFGSKSLSAVGSTSADIRKWYLSYLDSDTV